MAADISPMDVLTHIPILVEESQNAYVFVPSKELLGHASSTKRPTSCVMICPDMAKKGKKVEGAEDYKEAYDELLSEVKELVRDVYFPFGKDCALTRHLLQDDEVATR
jgi:H/ACA ribonucleoprotein complex subunit 2